MTRLTDEEVVRDYWHVMGMTPPPDQRLVDSFTRMVGIAREQEPRINCGTHLLDYMSICDEDDTMDSFYGPDYFTEECA